MRRRLLYWITDRLPCRIISEGDAAYMERYYLFTLCGVTFYIHRFVASDPDRGWHDHPWPWAMSFILRGWYWEHTRRFDQSHRVRWFNFLLGDSFHRVVLPDGVPEVWTLFVHREGNVKDWGFLKNKGQLGWVWVPHTTSNKMGQWWKTAPRGRDEPRRVPR